MLEGAYYVTFIAVRFWLCCLFWYLNDYSLIASEISTFAFEKNNQPNADFLFW